MFRLEGSHPSNKPAGSVSEVSNPSRVGSTTMTRISKKSCSNKQFVIISVFIIVTVTAVTVTGMFYQLQSRNQAGIIIVAVYQLQL